ncbi:MAG TPA: integron integrase, partial [Candidatus Lambdaproteobacteria bacterium]|nr:integron integrase [Candidatus Lambdaproteobacteria bacterium]
KKVEDFLNYLAIERNVAASTQNQAFNALVFLYKRVLKSPFENVKAARSRKEARIPVVLTREEVKQVLSLLDGVPELVVKLLYGCGLRITEAVKLRVQNIDFGFKQVTVRDGKGLKDRVTPFPDNKDLETTMIYTHILKQGGEGVLSPLDDL